MTSQSWLHVENNVLPPLLWCSAKIWDLIFWYRVFFFLRGKWKCGLDCSLPLLNRSIRIYLSALVFRGADGASPALLNHQRRVENIAARVVCGARTRNNFLVCILKTCRIYCLLNRATNITRHAQFGWPATAPRSALLSPSSPLQLSFVTLCQLDRPLSLRTFRFWLSSLHPPSLNSARTLIFGSVCFIADDTPLNRPPLPPPPLQRQRR